MTVTCQVLRRFTHVEELNLRQIISPLTSHSRHMESAVLFYDFAVCFICW